MIYLVKLSRILLEEMKMKIIIINNSYELNKCLFKKTKFLKDGYFLSVE